MTTSIVQGNAQVFLLPDLGEGLTEAEIVRWLVAVDDEVGIDQPIAEVETAKSIVEVPSPFAGKVAILHGVEGETIAVGTPLITIEAKGQADAAEIYREEEKAGSGNVLIGYGTDAGQASVRRRRPRAPRGAAAESDATNAAGSITERRAVPLVISPLVRVLAREYAVDLGTLTGTGAGGVITRADVTASIGKADQNKSNTTVGAVAGERRTPLNGFRKAVSATLSRSRSEIPEATVWVDVDATALWELREAARTPNHPGPGLMAFIARFVVSALKEHPVFNGQFDTERDEIVEFETINLGIAVQSERGLVVPAVMDAGSRTSLLSLDEEIRAVTQRARDGRSTPEELTAGTFTLNNYGGFRVDGSAPIINHPQVAILGLGRIIDRAWVVDGEICIRKITQMSFVFDHRVCDGGTAASFMRGVADAIENPTAAIVRL